MTQFYPIRLVRLVTGETLVTGIGDGGKSKYVLERPMLMVTVTVDGESDGDMQTPQQVSLMFKDWIDFTSDDYLMVPKSMVVCIAKPLRAIVSDYTQARMNSDIIEDLNERGGNPTVDDVFPESGEGGDSGDDASEGKPDSDEFPGWGGDPDLGG